jgi:hypothetical protein
MESNGRVIWSQPVDGLSGRWDVGCPSKSCFFRRSRRFRFFLGSMKTSWAIIALASLSTIIIPAQDTPYEVIERGPNHRVWQRTNSVAGPEGKLVLQVHRYTELASGLNFWDSTSNQWVESKEEIEPFEQGAIARQGQYLVIFANNLNSAGAIDLQTPDAKRLRSNVLGLGYYDNSTSNSVLIAQLQNSEGELIASNQVLYPNAFEGVKADVRYTYRKDRFEQDVILREQPPAPEIYGLNPETTELEVITEFIDPPPAKVEECKGQNDEPIDEDISWGATRIGHGRAFDLGEQKIFDSRVPVKKQYNTIQGRTFLLEKVLVKSIQSHLANLPAQARAKSTLPAVVSRQPLLPPAPLAQAAEKPMKLASGSFSNKGYVLDYVTINSGLTNYTFMGNNTYYISGGINLIGITTFEGGTVIKFAAEGRLDIAQNGSIDCRTGQYRPAILTSINDNTIGQGIEGSDGNPTKSDVTTFLNIYATNIVLRNIRFSHANTAIYDFNNLESGSTLEVWDCQFVDLEEMMYVYDVGLHNVLISQAQGANPAIQFFGMKLVGEHVTRTKAAHSL